VTEVKNPPKDELKTVYDWMHKEGEPDPSSNMDPTLIVLMDIAVNIRRLVQLSETSMEMNQAILASLDTPGTNEVN
jgi:hypothetical protein